MLLPNATTFNYDVQLTFDTSFTGKDLLRTNLRGGNFTFNGTRTGLPLADFLSGQLFRLEHGAPGALPLNQTYLALYGQDSWRLGSGVTLNYGLRWEPFFGQSIRNGAVSNCIGSDWMESPLRLLAVTHALWLRPLRRSSNGTS